MKKVNYARLQIVIGNIVFQRFVMKDPYITINTYHQLMDEAMCSLRSGLSLFRQAEKCAEEKDLEKGWLYIEAGIRCRYSFLLAANALEAAANALLLDLKTSKALYEDFEKLSTLLKFEIVCMMHGRRLDRGNILYGRIKEIVQCRNEFVHPKPLKVPAKLTPDGRDMEIIIKKTKNRSYPTSFTMFEPKHSRDAMGDILQFVSWVVFDVLGFEIRDGVLRIGFGSSSVSSDELSLGDECGFDMRTFGERKIKKAKRQNL